MRLCGMPRDAARVCLEADSETFMLDDAATVPMALVPYVEAERFRHRRHRWRHRLALAAVITAVLVAAVFGWAF